MKKLVILGASGHGRVVADIARLSGYTEIVFRDDDPTIGACGKYPVVGSIGLANREEGLTLPELTTSSDWSCFVAIGNPEVRQKLTERLLEAGVEPVTLIHPNAVVAEDVTIDCGTVVMAGAVINPGAVIGKGCIINTCASVDHDCTLSDYIHIAVGAHLAGTVSVGQRSWIGAGAVVSNNLSIGSDVMIGAGAAVVRDISEPGTYIGVPARLKHEEIA